MNVNVETESEALALVARIEGRLTADFGPFFARLGTLGDPNSPLAGYMQARWDRAFDLGLKPADSTVEERSDALAGVTGRDSYYERHRPNSRARPSGPYFEWTGSLREAASGFTTVEGLRAEIDPDRNYRGPLGPGGWSETGARFLTDEALFRPAELDRMVDAELERWMTAEIERL